MPKTIHAPATALLIGKRPQQQTATSYARTVTAHARAVTKLQARARRLKKELRHVMKEVRNAQRQLRLVAGAIEPFEYVTNTDEF